jgi:hypothetical protein
MIYFYLFDTKKNVCRLTYLSDLLENKYPTKVRPSYIRKVQFASMYDSTPGPIFRIKDQKTETIVEKFASSAEIQFFKVGAFFVSKSVLALYLVIRYQC